MWTHLSVKNETYEAFLRDLRGSEDRDTPDRLRLKLAKLAMRIYSDQS